MNTGDYKFRIEQLEGGGFEVGIYLRGVLVDRGFGMTEYRAASDLLDTLERDYADALTIELTQEKMSRVARQAT